VPRLRCRPNRLAADQYEMGAAEAHFGLGHDETVATLSGAHTIGKSRVHGVNPTSRGVVSF
jgi:catalase (peroxidase I)